MKRILCILALCAGCTVPSEPTTPPVFFIECGTQSWDPEVQPCEEAAPPYYPPVEDGYGSIVVIIPSWN